MKLDEMMRESMRKCVEAGGEPVIVSYMLGKIPWLVTVQVDASKIPQQAEGESNENTEMGGEDPGKTGAEN